MNNIQLFTEEQKNTITELCQKYSKRFFINDTDGQCNNVTWTLIPKVNDSFIIASKMIYIDFKDKSKINELEFKPQLVSFDMLVKMIENSEQDIITPDNKF